MNHSTRDDETSVEHDGEVFKLETAGETLSEPMDRGAQSSVQRKPSKRRITLSGLAESEIEESLLLGPGSDTVENQDRAEPGLDSYSLLRDSGLSVTDSKRAPIALPASSDIENAPAETEPAAPESRDVEAMTARAELHAKTESRSAIGGSAAWATPEPTIKQERHEAQPELERRGASAMDSGRRYEETAIIRRPVFSAERIDETPPPGSMQGGNASVSRSDFAFSAEDGDEIGSVHSRRRWLIALVAVVVCLLGSALVLYATGIEGSGDADVSASGVVSAVTVEPAKPTSAAETLEPNPSAPRNADEELEVGEEVRPRAEPKPELDARLPDGSDVARAQSLEKPQRKRRRLSRQTGKARGRSSEPVREAKDDEAAPFLKRSTLNPFDGDN